jgi:chaperonin cofactor prefoldin
MDSVEEERAPRDQYDSRLLELEQRIARLEHQLSNLGDRLELLERRLRDKIEDWSDELED